MEELIKKSYIHNIALRGLRNIKDVDILLDLETPQHLIITGNNGVGKTTFVKELYASLKLDKVKTYTQPQEAFKHLAKDFSKDDFKNKEKLKEVGNNGFLIECIKKHIEKCVVIPDNIQFGPFTVLRSIGRFLVLYYEARRTQNFITPNGPQKISETADSRNFIQAMVNQKAQAAFANLDGDTEKVKSIQDWFNRLEYSLSELLGNSDFKLDFKSEEYNFIIKENNKEPYHFTELSDGYSAILTMVTDIMLHMTTGPAKVYDKPGIVIIDELETHLHVELQSKILPFLTNLFPNIQFIVTTHSPFVLSSIGNAVIFDMQTLNQYEDFSQYSYSNIVEGYFNANSYSHSIIEKLNKASEYLSQTVLSEEAKRYIINLDEYIEHIKSSSIPRELIGRWLDIKLSNFEKFNGILQ